MFYKLLLYLERLAYAPVSPSEQYEVALNLHPLYGSQPSLTVTPLQRHVQHFNSTKIRINSAKENCSTALQRRTYSLCLRASNTKCANVASSSFTIKLYDKELH